ncbi:MAG: hypothetical protein AAGD06_19720 [Acidobacteriota bacterium]
MSRQPENRARPCDAPPRYKRALLTFVGLLGPVYLVPPALAALVPGHPVALIPLAVACIVVLMNYAIMPTLERLFGSWLRSSSSGR